VIAGSRIRILLVTGAVLLTVATTLDVLAGGALRQWDDRLMLGPHGLRLTEGGWFWVWRTLVWGGQFWLVGSLVGLAALWTSLRRRSPWPAVTVGVWLVVVSVVLYLLKTAFGRTAPASGVDLLYVAGKQSYPSGHAAYATSCLVVTAMLIGRTWATWAAHVLAVLVAIATVMLGYHWPTDSIAGWAFGLLCGVAGCWALSRFSERAAARPPE
jgi:membrane-associated phospholipid phosphatase